MLASAPPSARLHTGGGISVRVSSVSLGADKQPEEPAKIFNGNLGTKDADENSMEWGTATISWRGGAQRISSDGGPNNKHSSGASLSVDVKGPPQLVHVIRVKPVDPGKTETDTGGTRVMPSGGPAKIHITTTPNGSFVSKGYRNDKISVLVEPPVSPMVKGEDERSSSGASSAPGSDYERSDSDREDSNDSGFSVASRHHFSKVSVSANHSNDHLTSISESDSPAKPCVVFNNGKVNSNVRLTIASYSDKSNDSKTVTNGELCDMQFHLRELDSPKTDKKPEAEDIQTKISAAHALLSGRDLGGLKLHNKVRSSITSLLVQSASNRNYDQEEIGRIVFYTTSMGIVRTTSERCRKVRKILETLMVKFEERDVFMNRGFQQEVRERLGTNRVIVPQVFLEGRHLGSAEVIEQLNEIGHLRELLRPYKRQSIGGVCQQCGGYRYLLCPICGGSKKSVTHRHHFTEDLVALRCVSCDESGLIRCPQCINGEG